MANINQFLGAHNTWVPEEHKKVTLPFVLLSDSVCSSASAEMLPVTTDFAFSCSQSSKHLYFSANIQVPS